MEPVIVAQYIERFSVICDRIFSSRHILLLGDKLSCAISMIPNHYIT